MVFNRREAERGGKDEKRHNRPGMAMFSYRLRIEYGVDVLHVATKECRRINLKDDKRHQKVKKGMQDGVENVYQ